MPKIGVDIMGGDKAPQVVLEGCYLALEHLAAGNELVLFGPEDQITGFMDSKKPVNSNWSIVNATERIEMHEHPVRALQEKRDSSMNIGFRYLAASKIDGFASAGHSGAVMVAAFQALGTLEGFDRPVAVAAFPQADGSSHILLDVGINVDCRPQQFLQFAELGSIYSRQVYGIESPRVALLNTGTEPTKGSSLYQKAHELLKNHKEVNFVGNLEARDFYDGVAEVSVCDGFTGNIFLKQAEGFYNLFKMKGVEHPFLESFNYEQYGGTPILGLHGNVVLGHGASSAEAIKNMIVTTEKIAEVNLASRIENHISNKWHSEQL